MSVGTGRREGEIMHYDYDVYPDRKTALRVNRRRLNGCGMIWDGGNFYALTNDVAVIEDFLSDTFGREAAKQCISAWSDYQWTRRSVVMNIRLAKRLLSKVKA